MQEPSNDNTEGQEKKNQQRERGGQGPEQEADVCNICILNNENNAEASKSQKQNEFEMHSASIRLIKPRRFYIFVTFRGGNLYSGLQRP